MGCWQQCRQLLHQDAGERDKIIEIGLVFHEALSRQSFMLKREYEVEICDQQNHLFIFLQHMHFLRLGAYFEI